MAIEDNMVVAIEYELTDNQSKEVLDTNVGKAPLEFILGKGQIIPGLESKIAEMNEGDKENVIVAAENAYGTYNTEAVETYPREQFAGIELEEGMALYGQAEDGSTVQVTVKNFSDEEVTIDYNHPLAGKELHFALSILNVREMSAEECATGQCCSTSGHDHGQGDGGGSCCGGGHCGSH